MEILNELTNLSLGYHLFLLTDFCDDTLVKDIAGYSMVGITSINIIINFTVIIYQTVLILKASIQKRCKNKNIYKMKVPKGFQNSRDQPIQSTSGMMMIQENDIKLFQEENDSDTIKQTQHSSQKQTYNNNNVESDQKEEQNNDDFDPKKPIPYYPSMINKRKKLLEKRKLNYQQRDTQDINKLVKEDVSIELHLNTKNSKNKKEPMIEVVDVDHSNITEQDVSPDLQQLDRTQSLNNSSLQESQKTIQTLIGKPIDYDKNAPRTGSFKMDRHKTHRNKSNHLLIQQASKIQSRRKSKTAQGRRHSRSKSKRSQSPQSLFIESIEDEEQDEYKKQRTLIEPTNSDKRYDSQRTQNTRRQRIQYTKFQ